ncbi:HAD family hydrolase [Fundidesulfovibrio butyratiphilus]
MARLRNVLLDRDGTIIVEKHYLCDPDQVELAAGAGPALARLSRAGVGLYVVTNQSGIGRGYYGEADFLAVQARLDALLADYGVRLNGVAHCPHDPKDGCDCRKPAPGLWSRLSRQAGLDPASTVMVGDNASDVAFGLGCGLAESILVLTGHGARFAAEMGLTAPEGPWVRIASGRSGHPTVLARDLPAAASFLLRSFGDES